MHSLLSLSLLTGCGNPPYLPRHMPGLNFGHQGLSVALHALNKPDLLEDPCVCLPMSAGRELGEPQPQA